MKEISKLGLKLLLICLVSALLLAVTNEATKNQIAAQREAANQAARQEVLSAADRFEYIEGSDQVPNVIEAYVGYANDQVIGYVVKTAPVGFGGPVEVVTGLGEDGSITGVRVGSHAETPGLGANVTLPWYYNQYEGLGSTGPVGVSKVEPGDNEIQAVAGATITSQAVTDGVNFALEAFEEFNN